MAAYGQFSWSVTFPAFHCSRLDHGTGGCLWLTTFGSSEPTQAGQSVC